MSAIRPSRAGVPQAPAYSDDEDATIIRMIAEGAKPGQIAEAIGRSPSSASVRIFRLRQAGRIPPGKGWVAKDYLSPVSWTPAIVLHNDDKLVKACVAQGGFPKAIAYAGKTYWLNADNGPWQHKPRDHQRRLAA